MLLNSRLTVIPLIDHKSENNSQKNYSHCDPDTGVFFPCPSLLIDEVPVYCKNNNNVESAGAVFTKIKYKGVFAFIYVMLL